MSEIQELRRARLADWVALNGGHAKVVAKYRLKTSRASYLSQCVNGYAMGEKAARNWEKDFKLPAGYLDAADLLEVASDTEIAHSVSQLSIEDVPLYTWGQLMSEVQNKTLAGMFRVTLPDDAMGEKAKAGSVWLFLRDEAPKFGDAVIVKDSHGGLHFRLYRQGDAPGTFEAHAVNANYKSFNSVEHGLVVIGVMRIPMAGWGDL